VRAPLVRANARALALAAIPRTYVAQLSFISFALHNTWSSHAK
jgi:hypothetical protein